MAKKVKYSNSAHIHKRIHTHIQTHNNQNVCKKRMGTIEDDSDDEKRTV